jgi:hypothetical protein
MALRKFWTAKCVDPEWEVEWQGPIFGVHLGIDFGSRAKGAVAAAGDAASKEDSPRLRIGDPIRVRRRKSSRRFLAFIRARPAVVAAAAVLLLALAAAVFLGSGCWGLLVMLLEP